MREKGYISKYAGIGLLCIVSMMVALCFPAQAFAQTPVTNNGTCINCHEDMYFLHDTGNWFCIRESPMRCVDCHCGNSTALTAESAHLERAKHPVINEDLSTCQQCHLDDCPDRVDVFDEVAGISEVKIASPLSAPAGTSNLPASEEQSVFDRFVLIELIPVVILIAMALTVYLVQKIRTS